MGLFGSKPKKGISEYELTEHGHRLEHRLDAAFNDRSKRIREEKRSILKHALGMNMDRDPNMPITQKKGVIQADEFENVVGGLEKTGVFTKKEADQLRATARDALKD